MSSSTSDMELVGNIQSLLKKLKKYPVKPTQVRWLEYKQCSEMLIEKLVHLLDEILRRHGDGLPSYDEVTFHKKVQQRVKLYTRAVEVVHEQLGRIEQSFDAYKSIREKILYEAHYYSLRTGTHSYNIWVDLLQMYLDAIMLPFLRMPKPHGAGMTKGDARAAILHMRAFVDQVGYIRDALTNADTVDEHQHADGPMCAVCENSDDILAVMRAVRENLDDQLNTINAVINPYYPVVI